MTQKSDTKEEKTHARSPKGKRLFLLRHALTLGMSETGDRGRKLAPRGIQDAKALASLMAGKGYIPDIILCSNAVRTRETLTHIQEGFSCENIRFLDILYTGYAGDYLYEIQQISDDYQNILVLAHNPSIYELVVLLAAQGHDSMMQRLSEGYQPATLSVVSCLCEKWSDIQPAENELVDFTDPMDYNTPARPTRWM